MRSYVAMLGLLLSGPALGQSVELPISRPAPVALVAGECPRTFPMTKGRAFPPTVAGAGGLAACSAVIVPLADYADLLATEEWATAIALRYQLDVAELRHDRDWYKTKLEKELEPKPWLERPGTQRWFGRLETLVTVGVVAVGLSAAYSYGSGGLK